MMARHSTFFVLLSLLIATSACAPQTQFYWGTYEETLYSRQQLAGAGGEAEAVTALAAIITEAASYTELKVAPGIHADYGYLLFKQGKTDDAIAQLQQEAALYPESRALMEKIISRMKGLKDQPKDQQKEKKAVP